MKKELSSDELSHLSQILRIDHAIIQQINAKGILNPSKARSYLILKEYQNELQNGLPKKEVVSNLANKYSFSKSSVELIIYNKKISNYTRCDQCNREISRYKYGKNGGICDICGKILT